MSLLCSNIIKAEDVQIKGKKTIRTYLCNPKEDSQALTEAQLQRQEELEDELARKEESIKLKLAEAKSKYEEIINAAKEESERLIKESQDKALDIEKQAYEQGHSQGIKNGYEDGYKEAYEDNIEKAKYEAAEIVENANKIMIESKNQVVNYMKENKGNILNLSLTIAEQVLREKFEDVSSMDSLLINIIEEYNLKENFVIKVNPLYKDSLDEQVLKLKESYKVNGDVFVLSDESIEQGNVVIDNVNGRLVVGIDHVIDKIKEELL